MTEKQKMIKGELYDAGDVALVAQRTACKELCYDYNHLRPSAMEERCATMRKLLGSSKGQFTIESSVWFDYGYNISIGENFYSNHNLVILDAARVTFGDNVFIAPNCGFYTATHPTNTEARNKGLEYAKPISIGNNVWIGAGVSVLAGVEIGDNCVIGAGSVVVKSIPPDSIAVGNPCRVIRSVDCL